MLGSRFRIIGLLGVGGMGEVYRADDLKLGQPVALKFLPQALVTNPIALERFYVEVRTARQISHPNVCRVYDVDEADGRHFLSMEFIDGEDLASLLKRIGHLPAGKVLEIAQHLCAGLAAAHRRGIVHRDLKPANVMVDGRGYARIMDFGLAAPVNVAPESGAIAGTPLYMAPEQLAGRGASIQSDIYSLGLVLYELCTGRSPFRAASFEDLRLEKEALVPPAPSELARDVDPAIERVILACIERDPAARPASVLQIAAALPGGNPVAAAIAAGDTPSPEMVAASAVPEGLRPARVVVLTVGIAVAVAASVWLGQRAILPRRTPLERPPAVLVDRAQQIAAVAGYVQPPADTAFGIGYNDPYLLALERDTSTARWATLSADAVRFWYRQSEGPLRRLTFGIGVSPAVTPEDPPMRPGDLLIVLNGAGRLIRFEAIPSTVGPTSGTPDWTSLFRQAGLDASWPSVDSPAPPLYWADQRLSWRLASQERAGRSVVSVEAASARGQPTEFRVVHTWDRDDVVARTGRLQPLTGGVDPADAGTATANMLGIVLSGIAMFGSLILARRNLRLGRGDRRGATRLASFVVAALACSWIFDEHHVADAHEWYLIISFAGRALVIGGVFWWTYVAFEPYVRRHWPSTIVSWSRVLTGRIRDPLVGRDVLVGVLAGSVVTCVLLIGHLAAGWLGWPAERLATPTWHAWLGPGHALSLALQLICYALLESFTALFILVLLRMWMRREALAAVVAAALLATPDVLLSEHPAVAAGFYFTVFLIGVMLLMRVGLVATIALRFTVDLLQAYPIVTDLSAWYASLGLAALALLAGLVMMSAHAAVGGRRGALTRSWTGHATAG
jgi:hypothetical protein